MTKMTLSQASIFSLGWPKWPCVNLWACLLLYWLYPGTSCTDRRQSTPVRLPIVSSGHYGGVSQPKLAFTLNQTLFVYSWKNGTVLDRLGYLHFPNKVYLNLSLHHLRKSKLWGVFRNEEVKEDSFRYSGIVSTIPMNITVVVNTAEKKGGQRQSQLVDALLNNMQQIQKLLESKIITFINTRTYSTLNTLRKFICSHFQYSCWLEMNGSKYHIVVSAQRFNSSSLFSLRSKRSHPTIRIINKRRPYRRKLAIRRLREEFVYGQDDRRRISPILLRTFPYSNVVRLSTGCTGTLLTPLHVLTAAHCVHNGYGFRENLEMMRVEVPYPMGVRVFYIEKISIPSRWKHPRIRLEHQEAWDYAVVTLIYGVHGRSRFYPLAVSTTGMIEKDLIFLAFTKEHTGHNQLWFSKCPGPSNKPLVDRSLIFTHCDSAVGNSGAAILAKDGSAARKIIGVLSSTIQVRQSLRPSAAISNSKSVNETPTRPLSFSVITALTWPKLWDICRELGSEGIAYGVCPKPQYIPVKNRHLINNIPFFG